jgi:prolipoprotein diacylglyceryltransferase
LVWRSSPTLGDYTWYTLNVRHGVMTGIIHGAVLLTAVGAVLGLDAGKLLKGLPIGALAGVGGALIYYLLVAIVDGRTYGTANPASWVAMWLLLALLDGRWLRDPHPRSGGRLRRAGCSPP